MDHTAGRDLAGDTALGWEPRLQVAWEGMGAGGASAGPLRVVRIDRGWSTVLRHAGGDPQRTRNIGAEVAVGDWIAMSGDGERVAAVVPRTSAFIRRASHEGSKAEAHVLGANADAVFLVHALVSPPNQRRLERELVLAFDSGARPVVVLTKLDAVDDAGFVERSEAALTAVAAGVSVHLVSGRRGDNLDDLRVYADGHRTVGLLGASGVGKSTLVNALVGCDVQRVAEVREHDHRGRHTTIAAELVPLPGGGWLLDTPGLRAVSLWSSGTGIERAFPDVFALSERCRFRDCKHEDEPGCAVQAAIAAGGLHPARLVSMKRLVAEELALEDEQRARDRSEDRRGFRRPRPRPSP